MTAAEILGYLFGAYAVGCAWGWLLLAFKRLTEVST